MTGTLQTRTTGLNPRQAALMAEVESIPVRDVLCEPVICPMCSDWIHADDVPEEGSVDLRCSCDQFFGYASYRRRIRAVRG